MTPTPLPKFGLRFLTRKERTVRRVTKCETRQITKRLEPTPLPTLVKLVRPRVIPVRSKPATLVKIRQAKKVKPIAEVIIIENSKGNDQVSCSSNRSVPTGRILQSDDLQKLSRLSCSLEFSLFNKEMKGEMRTHEHQLSFFQTKLNHLKNEFQNETSQQRNLQQIREYFAQALQKNFDRRIKPDEFNTLAEKLKQDIKQAIDKWLKRKEFGKQLRPLSEYSQRRQIRVRQLIKESIEENKKQSLPEDLSNTDSQDQSKFQEQIIH